MANLFDYLAWRGDLTLEQAPFGNVDSLILCRLSYLPLDGLVPESPEGPPLTVKRLAGLFFGGGEDRGDSVLLKEDVRLLTELAQCPRFSSMELSYYVNRIDFEREEQFSAVTVLPGNGEAYVAFRGTDNTLVGWKEDFNMSFLDQVPAQGEALEYLEEAASRFPGPLRVGGHSKGGNLAVYSAAFCAPGVRERIVRVYNNDGPGFGSRVISERAYQAVRDRISTFVPQSSMIGMLMDHQEEYTVVHSTQVGLLQHDLYSWEVLRDDFIRLSTVTGSSRFFDRTMNEWIAGMTREQREQFVDALYEILGATDARTLKELTSSWAKSAGLMLKTLKNVDEPTRKILSQMLSLLFRTAKKGLSAAWTA